MSSLPMKKTHKVYIYGALIMTTSTASFYRSSLPLVDMLEKFDEIYKLQYETFVK